MGSARFARDTKAAARRSSPWVSGGRSRRSQSPARPTMTCNFSAWSLSKLAELLVAEGVVDDISHEGLRALLHEEGVTFQRLKTWKASTDPDYAVNKARVEHLYAIADGEVIPEPGEPEVIFCVDEFGPLNLQPRPGRQWAAVSGKGKEPARAPRRRLRATYTRTAYELGEDKMFGHIKPRKNRTRFLEFCRYLW